MIPEGHALYARSLTAVNEVKGAMVRGPSGKRLWLSRPSPGFSGEAVPGGGVLCPVSFENAGALARVLPWLSPRRLPEGPSFGFGDRIGLATPGHIQALTGSKVFPILAQQSVRENARTGRTFAQVLADAVFGVFQEGHRTGFGADADHLKTVEEALHAAELGFTFFTCDPSDHVVPVERLSKEEVAKLFRSSPDEAIWRGDYLGREFVIGPGRALKFEEDALVRAAVKYGAAVRFAAQVFRALASRLPNGFDFELSVDETESPTAPFEHLFLVLELRRLGVTLTSLAPRFSGAMEKAVDWRGDLSQFRAELRAHVAIAKAYGPYKISLHSGSDKFSLYPVFAEVGEGLWHIKTAGTSYLVALAVAGQQAPDLFREIARLSLARFPEDRKSYHLSTDPRRIPDLARTADPDLPRLLAHPDFRQVLHVAYGSVLQSPLGKDLHDFLLAHEREYHEALAEHLKRHLELLGVKQDV